MINIYINYFFSYINRSIRGFSINESVLEDISAMPKLEDL